MLAAARFCDTLAEEGLEGRSGVATGTVWCGRDLSRPEHAVGEWLFHRENGGISPSKGLLAG